MLALPILYMAESDVSFVNSIQTKQRSNLYIEFPKERAVWMKVTNFELTVRDRQSHP